VDIRLGRVHARRGGMHPRQQALQAREPRRKRRNTVVRIRTHLGDVIFGGTDVAMVAGPAQLRARPSFSNRQHVKSCRRPAVSRRRLQPRTSPYSFQGLGEPGLKILAAVREEFGLGIVTEAIDNESLDLVETICGRDSDRSAQHAEFFSAETRGPLAEACLAETRNVRHARRIPDGRGILDVRGKLTT